MRTRRVFVGAVALAAASMQPASADTAPHVLIEHPREREILLPKPQADVFSPLEPIVIDGAAGDDVAVYAVTLTIYDSLGRASSAAPECNGCGARVATWSTRIFLPPGTYVAEATAVDSAGFSRTSPRRSFTVV